MRSLPVVSAVIPTRDRPALLRRAVASALAQCHVALEVVVVDDGSDPPGDPGVDDPRVRVVRLEEGRGPATARNEGIAAAEGEFIAFLDDDDEWRPGKTARQVAHLMAAGPDLAVLGAGFDLWDGSSLVRRVPGPAGDLRVCLLERPCLAPSTVIARHAALDEAGGFDPTLRRCEDWDLWLRLADHHRTAALREILVDRRMQPVALAASAAAIRELRGRLRPRIEALPHRERRRILAQHCLVDAVLQAQMGRRREARALMWSAWRRNPRSPRPLAHMVRTVVGEPLWEDAALRARRFRYGLAPGSSERGAPLG